MNSMDAAPTPDNETGRLKALQGYGILETGPAADFDALVHFIASVCGTPMAAIVLLDQDRQWFKASVGLPMKQTDRRLAFCAHAIVSPDRPFVVSDATLDERFADNPLVTGDPHMRFYAGVPIVTPEGFALGTICVMDREARELSPLQLKALTVAAQLVMTLIEHNFTSVQLALAKQTADAVERERVAMTEYLNRVEDERVRVANELHAEASRRAQFQSELAYAQKHDPLTTLPNSREFMNDLELAFTALRKGPRVASRVFSVYVVHIDHCRQVNDSFGKKAGDNLLIQCAERLLDVVQETDIVARLDSDAFAIIAFDTSTAEATTSIARKIRTAFRTPWHLGQIDSVITASVGVAIAGDHYSSAEHILRDATIAMYHSKEHGRDRYTLFQESFGAVFQSRVELDRTLSQALVNNEFRLVYQPIVALASDTGRLEGFEALMRWEHPLGTLVPPTAFIPAAEESGLIVPLGAWALKTACLALRSWRTGSGRSGRMLQMSVNVSAIQLCGAGFSTAVRDIIDQTGIDPRELAIEVTEGAALHDPDHSLRALQELREFGVGIHVDDFGTGYSSLSYLRRLPVTRVKIDRSFVSADGGDNLVDPVIVGAVISLAHQLDLKVIAEGVETATQMDALKDLGCDSIQGYYISRPVTVDEAKMFVKHPASIRKSA
jgi:diguanylate cyclase (GGDEF)-like protein